jgi:hypothetical protein
MIAPNDSNHSEPGGDSSDESAMTGAPADIGVIEAAYHDGVVAGVAAYVGNTRSGRRPLPVGLAGVSGGSTPP